MLDLNDGHDYDPMDELHVGHITIYQSMIGKQTNTSMRGECNAGNEENRCEDEVKTPLLELASNVLLPSPSDSNDEPNNANFISD